jgi:RNA polymerase sigma-70 factor, ECF subfamily
MGNFQPVVARMLEQLQDAAAKRYREYLLGGLASRQRAAIERQILTNDSVFQELRAAEEALVQDYLDDTLPANARARFHMLLSSSRIWREKVEFERALRAVTQRARKGGSVENERVLFEQVFAELEKLASRYLARESYSDFEPTDLVHEAYLRLSAQGLPERWADRAKFLATAARAMRHVLVDSARIKRAAKRDERGALPLEAVEVAEQMRDADLVLDIDMALTELAAKQPRQSRVVELRMFGGLSDEEVADAMNISVRTVKRAWQIARVWLQGRLQPVRPN